MWPGHILLLFSKYDLKIRKQIFFEKRKVIFVIEKISFQDETYSICTRNVVFSVNQKKYKCSTYVQHIHITHTVNTDIEGTIILTTVLS